MRRLAKLFPVRDVASAKQSEAGAKFEARHASVNSSAAIWKQGERERFRAMSEALFEIQPGTPKNHKALLLDGHDLLGTREFAKLFRRRNIFVPNWEAATIADRHPKSSLPQLFGADICDFVKHVGQDAGLCFRTVWLDACCQCGDRMLQMIGTCIERRIFDPSATSLVGFTFCGEREKAANRQLTNHLDQGITRPERLRGLISDMANRAGSYYAIESTSSMMLNTKDHGMYTLFLLVTPRHLADTIDMCALTNAFERIQAAAQPQPRAKKAVAKRKRKSELTSNKRFGLGVIRRNQHYEINFRDCRQPVVILDMFKPPNGEECVKCRTTPIRGSVVTDTIVADKRKLESQEYCTKISRLGKSHHAIRHRMLRKGARIEVAWRCTQYSTTAWWTATVLEPKRKSDGKIKVKYAQAAAGFPTTQWVDADCCRKYKL